MKRAALVLAILGLAACKERPTPTETLDIGEDYFEIGTVSVDRATGCQYLGSTAYTITPRMAYIRNQYVHLGCVSLNDEPL